MTEINHSHEHSHSHEHHHRSSRRNAVLAATQIPLGLATGSLVCLVAGAHNLVDSKVHNLRHDAAIDHDKHFKKKKRLQGAALLAGSAVMAYLAERFTGMRPESTALISGVFSAETIVNSRGVVDDFKQVRDTDTKASLTHNTVDAAVSGATAIATGLPLVFCSMHFETIDSYTGYAHLALIGGLAAKSAFDALKD